MNSRRRVNSTVIPLRLMKVAACSVLSPHDIPADLSWITTRDRKSYGHVTQPLGQHKENSMSKRNTVSVTIFSAFALTLCLFSAVINAQKGPEGTASTVKPVKGIDVVVVDNSGNIVNRTATDSSGHFKFPVLPAGSYSLKLSNKKTDTFGVKDVNGLAAKSTGDGSEGLNTCSITILGAKGGTRTEDWNLETNRIIIKSNSGTASRTTPGKIIIKGNTSGMRTTSDEDRINVVSDGKTPMTGIVQTTVRPGHSNAITNRG